jgi:hypothetical protein
MIMRPLLPLLLAISAVAADPAPQPASTAPGEAARIASEIIRARALDAAGAGQQELSTQLQALAKGLLDGRISLQEAAQVMQIAGSPRAGAAVAMTPEAKASAQRAASLLDGDAPAAPAVAAAKPAEPAPAPSAPKVSTEKPPLALPTMPNAGGPAKPANSLGKIYAVDNGADGKANVAAIGLGSGNGVTIGEILTVQRKGRTIAKCKVIKVGPNMSYAEIVKGSLADPKDDVKEDDVVTSEP